MYCPLAKIQFESNSQQRVTMPFNFEGVLPFGKDTIWKQFTTGFLAIIQKFRVYCPLAKIQFESNSQRVNILLIWKVWCIALWQRYNLKAIHNPEVVVMAVGLGVLPFGKDTIWKQFTTYLVLLNTCLLVYCPLAKIQFESNSQRSQRYFCSISWCIALWQR